MAEDSGAKNSGFAMLEVQATYRQGSFLLDASFRLKAPWAIIFGPSGTGKTTLLRILAGLIKIDQGAILLDGLILADAARGIHIRAGHRNIGLITQQPALFPHMSVQENVAFGLHNMNGKERDTRVAAMLELVQAQALSHRPARQLSGGEAQRVALARALVLKPRLLLLDEPFSALDGKLRQTIISDLTAWLAAHAIPAISVTHDVTEAFQTQAEILVLHEGRMTAQGPPDQVLAAERERLVAILSANRQRPALARE
jgi:ABC-type Fe3+/spermidine/putrescine transport system ATPase subunit